MRLRVCDHHVFKDRRAYLFRNLSMYFRIRYFSDMQSNSYPTWNFSLLGVFWKENYSLHQKFAMFLRTPEFQMHIGQ